MGGEAGDKVLQSERQTAGSVEKLIVSKVKKQNMCYLSSNAW